MAKLIKRYVIEYANDCFTLLEKANKTDKWTHISRIVTSCEYGYISNFEAVKKITEICENIYWNNELNVVHCSIY